MSGFSITLRSAADTIAFDRLKAVLTKTLGLDWKATAGCPDGWEIAEDCAEALWDAGFRLPDSDSRASGAAVSDELGQVAPECHRDHERPANPDSHEWLGSDR